MIGICAVLGTLFLLFCWMCLWQLCQYAASIADQLNVLIQLTAGDGPDAGRKIRAARAKQ
jgi:hypothetical protein